MEKKCDYCGKDLDLKRRQKRFCSRACKNRFQTKKEMMNPTKEIICLVCGKEFLAHRRTRKYCSDRCLWKGQYKKKFGRDENQTTEYRKKRLQVYEDQDKKCWLCNKDLNGKFQAHHKCENKKEHGEILVMCPTCHNLIHHITVHIHDDGSLTFHGKALEYLKEKK